MTDTQVPQDPITDDQALQYLVEKYGGVAARKLVTQAAKHARRIPHQVEHHLNGYVYVIYVGKSQAAAMRVKLRFLKDNAGKADMNVILQPVPDHVFATKT